MTLSVELRIRKTCLPVIHLIDEYASFVYFAMKVFTVDETTVKIFALEDSFSQQNRIHVQANLNLTSLLLQCLTSKNNTCFVHSDAASYF